MPGSKPTLIERHSIYQSYLFLKSYRAVSRMLGWSDKTIKLVVERWKENPEVMRKRGGGRPKKTTPHTDRRIIRYMKKDRSITSYQLRQELQLTYICDRTIRRQITESGEFASYWKTKTPFINETNRKKRMAWCRARVAWPVERWKRVLWTDESPFVLRFNRKTRVWRTHNERYAPWCSTATVKHDAKIQVWGCFAAHGVGNLYLVDGILERYQYQYILENEMLPSADLLFGREDWYFQQDNDPKHTANVIKQWFIDFDIPKMDWPAQSPDLNPIENLWSILDHRIKSRSPKNKAELFEIIKKAWYELPVDILTKLAESMPNRCQAVIDAKGYATKY
jgi:hypothetical protein